MLQQHQTHLLLGEKLGLELIFFFFFLNYTQRPLVVIHPFRPRLIARAQLSEHWLQ